MEYLYEDLNKKISKAKDLLAKVKEDVENSYNAKLLKEKDYDKVKNWIKVAEVLFEELDKIKDDKNVSDKERKKIIKVIMKFLNVSYNTLNLAEYSDVCKSVLFTQVFGALIGIPVAFLLLGPLGLPAHIATGGIAGAAMGGGLTITALIKKILRRGKKIIPNSKELEDKVNKIENSDEKETLKEYLESWDKPLFENQNC